MCYIKKIIGFSSVGILVLTNLVYLLNQVNAQGGGGFDPNIIGQPGNALNNFFPTSRYHFSTLLNILIGIRNFILFLGILLGIIFLVIGGINYLRAGGDEQKMETARKQILGGLIGIAVAVAAFVILYFIINVVREGESQFRPIVNP